MKESLNKLKAAFVKYSPVVLEKVKKEFKVIFSKETAALIKVFVTDFIASISSKQKSGSRISLPELKKLPYPSKKGPRPEDVIENYQFVEILPVSSTEERFHYTLKNYAKSFLQTEDYSKFSMKLWELSESNEKPLLVMIMGEFKTGKSTFINAILGMEVLKSDVTPATAVVTMISYGETEKLVAHFQDGQSKEYDLHQLNELTAEGDDRMKALRSSIKYVELKLPLPLLTKITLIDTPGLNVDNELHIKATKQFMHEADIILWIFSYGKTASRTEMASISELGERLKPIAIINRIDEIDEEEETLEDVIEDIQKRLKSSVKGVYGVSAFLANKGLKEQNQELLKGSGWIGFSKMFDCEIVSQAANLKKQSIETKSVALSSELSEYMESLRKDLEYLNVKYNDKGKFEADIKQTISFFQKGITQANKIIEDESYTSREFLEKRILEIDDFNETQVYLLRLQDLKNVVHKLSDSKKIIEDITMYEQISKDTEKNFKTLEIEAMNLEKKIDFQNRDVSRFEQDVEKYNNSGLFGGRPLLDLDGKGKQLEQRRIRINNNYESIKKMQGNSLDKVSSLAGKITRQNQELYKYIQRLIKYIEIDIKKCENELITLNTDYEKNMNNLYKRHEALGYAERFLNFLNQEVHGNHGDSSRALQEELHV